MHPIQHFKTGHLKCLDALDRDLLKLQSLSGKSPEQVSVLKRQYLDHTNVSRPVMSVSFSVLRRIYHKDWNSKDRKYPFRGYSPEAYDIFII